MDDHEWDDFYTIGAVLRLKIVHKKNRPFCVTPTSREFSIMLYSFSSFDILIDFFIICLSFQFYFLNLQME